MRPKIWPTNGARKKVSFLTWPNAKFASFIVFDLGPYRTVLSIRPDATSRVFVTTMSADSCAQLSELPWLRNQPTSQFNFMLFPSPLNLIHPYPSHEEFTVNLGIAVVHGFSRRILDSYLNVESFFEGTALDQIFKQDSKSVTSYSTTSSWTILSSPRPYRRTKRGQHCRLEETVSTVLMSQTCTFDGALSPLHGT